MCSPSTTTSAGSWGDRLVTVRTSFAAATSERVPRAWGATYESTKASTPMPITGPPTARLYADEPAGVDTTSASQAASKSATSFSA